MSSQSRVCEVYVFAQKKKQIMQNMCIMQYVNKFTADKVKYVLPLFSSSDRPM